MGHHCNFSLWSGGGEREETITPPYIPAGTVMFSIDFVLYAFLKLYFTIILTSMQYIRRLSAWITDFPHFLFDKGTVRSQSNSSPSTASRHHLLCPENQSKNSSWILRRIYRENVGGKSSLNQTFRLLRQGKMRCLFATTKLLLNTFI